MDKELISLQNPFVKQWAQLKNRSGRDKYNQYVIEGYHLLDEAIKADASIDTIVYRMDTHIQNDLMQKIEQKSIPVLRASDQVIAKCTETQTPQPIFAIVNKPEPCSVEDIRHSSDLVIVIDQIQDPGNLGTIIRSADAVGASAVILGEGTVDVYNSKVIRASMGAIFHLPIIETELVSLLRSARNLDIQIVTTSLQSQRSCYEIDYRKRTWFLVGNEARGVSPSVASLAHLDVIIPMTGRAESLNVAMATTVLLFEASRQRSSSRA